MILNDQLSYQTLETVADKCGIPASTVYRIANGADISIENLIKYCNAYEINPVVFFIDNKVKNLITEQARQLFVQFGSAGVK